MSESITTYTGMFRGNGISPATATDVQALLVSVEGSLETVTAAVTAAETASAAALATATATAAAAATAQANLASTASTAEATLTASAATVTALVGTVTGSAAAAAASATAAAGSQSTASAAAVTATTKATAAGTSATAAGTSQTGAAASATTATTQASLATSQATLAATSATAALASAAASAASVVQAGANVGRNLIHNSMFNVLQRGVGPFSGGAVYAADRWLIQSAHSTGFGSLVALTNGFSLTSDEAAATVLSFAFTGGSASSDYDILTQRIEDVRHLAGKTVTVSFWARANSGTPKVGIELVQNFGNGGSPTVELDGLGSTSVTVSNVWARYQTTIALPSVASATFGASGGSFTGLNLWTSSGALRNARAGNIGVQSNTVDFWGVQLEVGATATDLEKPDYWYQLAQCQRFFQAGGFVSSGYGATGQTTFQPVSLAGAMRVAPTVVGVPQGGANYTSVSTTQTPTIITVMALVTTTGQAAFNFTFTASADL